MPRPRAWRPAGRRALGVGCLVLALAGTAALASSPARAPAPAAADAPAPAARAPRAPRPASTSTIAAPPTTPVATSLPVPAQLTPTDLDVRAGPVPVPLELRLPTIGLTAEVLGVGITEADAMDAPTGPAGDPVWEQAFWYRGSAVPGAASTAVIAGHVGGADGGPGTFEHLDELVVGDPIVVHDHRTDQDVRFTVTELVTYTLDEAARPDVLARLYGTGPVDGLPPQPSVDGLGHLTLVTCAGTFRGTTHDHRLAVYATRTP